LRRMSRPLALAFVGRRTAVLIGAGLLRLGGGYRNVQRWNAQARPVEASVNT
jgi:hypothetical protein